MAAFKAADATLNKPFLNAVVEILETTQILTIHGVGKRIIPITESIEQFIKAVKGGNQSNIDKVLKHNGKFAPIFDEYPWTKIDSSQFKLSSGMSQTTLNATITELVPCIAFMAKKRFTDPQKLYEFITSVDSSKYGVYVNSTDEKNGKGFIKSMPFSPKFLEKMENAIGVLSYLYDLNENNKIKQLFWGYRAKPNGVSSSHKGDIFVKFTNNKMMGISIKAGGEKTAEPQLNTYVNKFFDEIGYKAEKEELIKEVYTKIHSKLYLPKDWNSRANKKQSLNAITMFKNSEPIKYEKMYDEMLEICREAMISAINKNAENTIKYIKDNIIVKYKEVPLVVVKAFGKNYKLVTDEDDLNAFIPQIKKIEAKKSTSSKQNWVIDLKSADKVLTMKMSIRSNKTAPENKIAQGFDLSVKFNGLA